MADLIFATRQAACDTTKFDALYHSQSVVADRATLFFNRPVITATHNSDSATLLGCAAAPEGTVEEYLARLAEHFEEQDLVRIKMELAGQWILLVKRGDYLYICSDFLQIRPLYYAPEAGLVCSSFGPLYDTLGGTADSYKCFELLAMRHCLYPSWLGNTTLDNRIRSLQGYEYIKADIAGSGFEVKALTFTLDNTKISSLKEISDKLQSVVGHLVDRPEYRQSPVYATITGGFDSRLISAFVKRTYPDTRLRIAAFGPAESADLRIASRVAEIFRLPLDVFRTDKEGQKADYLRMTDSLSAMENAITTDLVLHNDAREIGFGGAMGTELLMSLPFECIDTLIETYTARVGNAFQVSDEFLTRFTRALEDEFAATKAHYLLQWPETAERDTIRLFMAAVTARFSGPLIAAFDIYGRQMEPLATYPVLETALKIDYAHLGGKGTFGRFYLIPKTIMGRLDRRAGSVDSTHFTPLLPLSLRTLPAYVIGRFRQKRYFAEKWKQQQSTPRTVVVETPDWSYQTTEWAEGFVARYLAEYRR